MLKDITAPDHVIALSLDDKLTGEGIAEYRQTLATKLENHAHISICIDLTRLTDITANAMVEGTKADLQLFSHLKQLRRCAFIADKEWPQAILSFLKPLIPTVEMKVFSASQSQQAINWAADIAAKSEDSDKAAIRFLKTTKDNVLAFEVDGVMSSEQMPQVIQRVEQYLNEHDNVRLLNRIKHFGGFDPSILFQSGLVSMKLSAMEKVERYAIVGAPGWMSKIIDTMNPVFPDIEMRTFALDQEADAWQWLDAELID